MPAVYTFICHLEINYNSWWISQKDFTFWIRKGRWTKGTETKNQDP